MGIKINKWDLIKLEKFYAAKETINKVIRQPSEWEKIIANETTGKGFIFKIYKQLKYHNTRKTHNSTEKIKNKKVGRKPRQTYLQRRCTDG